MWACGLVKNKIRIQPQFELWFEIGNSENMQIWKKTQQKTNKLNEYTVKILKVHSFPELEWPFTDVARLSLEIKCTFWWSGSSKCAKS